MEFLFKWNGQEIDHSSKQIAENDISKELTNHFEDSLSAPITVHLFNDALTSTITAVAVNSDGKQTVRITRLTGRDNATTYESI